MLLVFFLFLLGLVWGSAINVMVCRAKMSGKQNSKLTGKRSKCPHCGGKIAWYDNIPLLSFILLKRRCRHCGKKISWQYPLVELVTALLVVGMLAVETGLKPVSTAVWPVSTIMWVGFSFWVFQLICVFLIVGSLVAIFVYDLKHYLIPDRFVLLGGIAAGLYNLLLDGKTIMVQGFSASALLSSMTVRGLIGALIASGFFFCLVYFSKGKWMGWGDVKFAIFMGLALKFPIILIGLFAAYLAGSIIGVGLLAFKKKKMKSEIPFGPFLCLGTYVGLLFGQQIISWYLKMMS